MECMVAISRVEFLEVNPLFESELKLYFTLDDCECYTLIPGSEKELCKMFNLSFGNSEECSFKNIVGKKCRISKNEDSYTFVEYAEE